MQIKRKLEYPLWKIPYFLIKSLLILIKVIRTGILTPLIKNKFFNKQIELILRILNFIFVNNNKKDNHSRRGLVMLVGQRRRLMKYLRRKDLEKYEKVVNELKIRG